MAAGDIEYRGVKYTNVSKLGKVIFHGPMEMLSYSATLLADDPDWEALAATGSLGRIVLLKQRGAEEYWEIPVSAVATAQPRAVTAD